MYDLTYLQWTHLNAWRKNGDRGAPPQLDWWLPSFNGDEKRLEELRSETPSFFFFFFFCWTPERYPLKAMRRGLPQLESCRSSFIVVERHRSASVNVRPESVCSSDALQINKIQTKQNNNCLIIPEVPGGKFMLRCQEFSQLSPYPTGFLFSLSLSKVENRSTQKKKTKKQNLPHWSGPSLVSS